MIWCAVPASPSSSPYFQAYRDYVKGDHCMNQVYAYWETTWLEKV